MEFGDVLDPDIINLTMEEVSTVLRNLNIKIRRRKNHEV